MKHIYIVICKIVSGDLLFVAGHPKLVLFDNLDGWDGEGSRREFQEIGDI